MYKKTRNLFALCLTFFMLLTTVAFPKPVSAATTLGGSDRYATALSIVKDGWTTSENVIIARGDDLADALAAAPLAYAKEKAPILLTTPNKLPEGVLEVLKSLGVKNIYIVGGTGAVSTAVENALKDYNVIRISGKDRTETSYKVAIAAFGNNPQEVVLANGLAYADALSISSVAAVKGMPILLVGNNKLSDDVASYITGKTVYAVGGTGVISEVVVSTSKATRVSGDNRYETNASILTEFPQNYDKIYIAKGTKENLVDALAGSALAAIGNHPIVLVDGNSSVNPKLKDVIKSYITDDSTEVLLGGTVAPATADAVEALKLENLQVKSVSLNKTTDTLIVGGTDTLIATINPINVNNKAITWTSSDNNIATVDNVGKITGISSGIATITVTTVDGNKNATCDITVTSTLTAKQIMTKYGNSVVYIEVSDINHNVIASGSGFIVNSNGIVVTNFHVIKDCAYASVKLQNGTKYDVKSVLNYNEKQDIAILQLSSATNLSIAKLGDSDTVETGDNVVAIGSPQGYENTLSTGIISGINRISDRGIDFQTTASITHGSSGGALFDVYGNLIGIPYAGYDSAGDIGFVIPINEVKPFLNSSNEQTLLQVNNVQVNTEKFFPLLTDVPQPKNINYYKTSISDDGTYIFYCYSPSILPEDFFSVYYNYLEENGWTFYESSTDSYGVPYTYFVKGNYVVGISFIEQDVVIYGEIH